MKNKIKIRFLVFVFAIMISYLQVNAGGESEVEGENQQMQEAYSNDLKENPSVEETEEPISNELPDDYGQVSSAVENQMEIQQMQEGKETEVPSIGSISTNEINIQQGIFRVLISEINHLENIKMVTYAVWSEKDGQDDLKWYKAQLDGEGNYIGDVNIAEHNYEMGNYQVHVYFTDTSNVRRFGGSVLQSMDMTYGTLTLRKSGDTNLCADLNGVIVPGGIQNLKFAIWSSIGGQDDLIWYQASEVEDGHYEKEISILEHKGLGEYQVHAYVTLKNGQLIFLEKSSLKTDEPEIGKRYIDKSDIDKGKFRVELLDVKNENLISSISIGTWSVKDGQDDINWYEVNRHDDGNYYVEINIKNHNYCLGEYNFHIYIQDITGYQKYAGAMQDNAEIGYGEYDVEEKKDDITKFVVSLNDLHIPADGYSIYFLVWSDKDGQDDLVWYPAAKNSKGIYQTEVSLKRHNSLGLFHVHAYAVMPNNINQYICESSFQTRESKIDGIEILDKEKDQGIFSIELTKIENLELIKKIEVAVWSEGNQSDIIWYTAKKDSNNQYIVDVNIKNHKYNIGQYKVHLYFTDITGNKRFVKSAICDMSPQFSDFSIENTDGIEKEFNVLLSGLRVPAGVNKVQFAVWGENGGQNDIQWYTSKMENEESYSCIIPIKRHGELGKYMVHAYCITRGNELAFIGSKNFSVEQKPSVASVSVMNIDGTKGTFRVEISGVNAASGIETINVAIWHEGNQSDLQWYKALKTGEGKYIVNADVSNHGYHFGTYQIHVYVTMGNGINAFGNKSDTSILPINYVYSTSVNSTQREVILLGTDADVSRVQFATWSEENGQDDVIWYEGANRGGGRWSTIVDSVNHNSGGTYITHVYATNNRGACFLGSMKYSLVKIPTDKVLMQQRANMYSSSTPYLILVNRTTHKVGIFQGWQGNWNYVQYWDCSDGKASTPTVEGVFRVGSRGYYFDSGDSRCYWWTQFYGDYLFHSVLYNKYNGALNDGRLGMALSHGCVRLDINNAKWIYDVIPSGTTVVVYH